MKLYSLCMIYRNPNGAKEATGEYDKAGNAIVRSVIEIVPAEVEFDTDSDAEARELIDLGAAITVADYQTQQAEQAKAAQRRSQNGLRGDTEFYPLNANGSAIREPRVESIGR
jgi:hypothetical protein